jgi:uncharacterized protein (TIGR03437 family)
MRLTQGGTSVEAVLLFVSAGQINFIVPSNTPLGQVNLTSTFNGETSAPTAVQIVRTSFGLFTFTGGTGLAIIQNVVSATELPLNTPTNSAQLGQTLIAYGTGFGGVNGPDNVAPAAGDITTDVEILVGGVRAERRYSGRSPCCAGLDQLVFTLAENTPTGCYVPVVVRAGPFYSNIASIAVSPNGGVCSDPLNPYSNLVTGGATRSLGTVTLFRTFTRTTVQGQTFDSTTDSGGASFFRINETFFNPSFAQPSLGTCSVFITRISSREDNPIPLPSNPLDAGNPLTVNGPNGAKQIPRTSTGIYGALLGGGFNIPLPGVPPPPPLYLSAGRYTVSGPGGADIGDFRKEFDLGTPLTWTNYDQIPATVRTNAPLTVTWSGGTPNRDVVLILGTSTDSAVTVAGTFYCIAPLAPGRFEVPAYILASLPPTGSIQGIPFGSLSVSSYNFANPETFTARGLDLGLIYTGSSSSKAVAYGP